MKPGDLVRLRALLHARVAVSWTPARLYAATGAIDVSRFDTGTPALLLQTDDVEFREGKRSVSSILIGGRMGWVWPGELEPL